MNAERRYPNNVVRRAAIGIALTVLLSSAAAAPPASDLFEKRIRPVLVEKCYACHSAAAAQSGKLKGGLQLDTRAGIRTGGESGPGVVPGDPGKSLVVAALRHDGFEMPPSGKLPDAVVADFVRWIELGAEDPRDGEPVAVAKPLDLATAREHWAYQPIRVAPPPIRNTAWPRGEIDRYVLARLEAAGLQPTVVAAPHALRRRLSYDLTGLPPSPNDSVDDHAALVDRLLASPEFGVHWARHWLDGVRYNELIETVWRYRDWVVRSLNDDLPYDQFVLRQLAGDLLPAADDAERDRNTIATQLLCLNVQEMDAVEGMLEVVGQQLLGLSINCAKYHDHKFDALTQADYYALAGILTSSQVAGRKGASREGVPLRTQSDVRVMAVTESKVVADTWLLVRGERNQRGPLVPRRFPLVLAGERQRPLSERTAQSGRLELARWIVDPRNPLTARVMANRIWQRMIGRPLVATPNDFGTIGERPSHPELLDYLADRFIQSDWSVKALIREIALSQTYRQATVFRDRDASETARRVDPENRLLSRMPTKRLSYEQLLDSLLVAAEAITFGPPSSDVKRPANGFPFRLGAYRALYLTDVTMSGLFDGPDRELLTEARSTSVTAPQMLFFLNNNRTVLEAATAVATRCKNIAESGTNAPGDVAYRLILSRPPTGEESAAAERFVARQSLERLCHLLLASNEFFYLD